jgi:2-dehydro-3-deoxygluconokinase
MEEREVAAETHKARPHYDRYDVVTLGETMLRLTPPGRRRITQTHAFEVAVGGSESNTAVGLARLGLRVAWLSRLTDNALGQLIEQTIAGCGVDTTHVIWTQEDRVGIYFFEEGLPPRDHRIIYDRRGSAFSRMKPGDLEPDLFQPGRARLLHLTGITPALGTNAAQTARKALDLAKEAGWLVSFDINYRGRLWPPEKARNTCEAFARAADILICPLSAARQLYGASAHQTSDQSTEPAKALLQELTQHYPQATVVLTMGEAGALGQEPGEQAIHQSAFLAGSGSGEGDTTGRLGRGDAFNAGLIYAYLRHNGERGWLRAGLRWGAAVAAIKHTIPGDLPLIEPQEAQRLVEQEDARQIPLWR